MIFTLPHIQQASETLAIARFLSTFTCLASEQTKAAQMPGIEQALRCEICSISSQNMAHISEAQLASVTALRLALHSAIPVIIEGAQPCYASTLVGRCANRNGASVLIICCAKATDIGTLLGEALYEGQLVEARRKGLWVILERIDLLSSTCARAIGKWASSLLQAQLPSTDCTESFRLIGTTDTHVGYLLEPELHQQFLVVPVDEDTLKVDHSPGSFGSSVVDQCRAYSLFCESHGVLPDDRLRTHVQRVARRMEAFRAPFELAGHQYFSRVSQSLIEVMNLSQRFVECQRTKREIAYRVCESEGGTAFEDGTFTVTLNRVNIEAFRSLDFIGNSTSADIVR
jgi:hypothetical protein